jgi:hypothetical protein
MMPATGTAAIFGDAQHAERHLGLRSYQDVAPLASGMSQRMLAEPDVEMIAFDGTFDGFTAEGIDTRLKADDRISEFLALGGACVVRTVDVDGLDEIAAGHDLTLVPSERWSEFPLSQGRITQRL